MSDELLTVFSATKTILFRSFVCLFVRLFVCSSVRSGLVLNIYKPPLQQTLSPSSSGNFLFEPRIRPNIWKLEVWSITVLFNELITSLTLGRVFLLNPSLKRTFKFKHILEKKTQNLSIKNY